MSLLYAGLDVSLEMTSICVVDSDGRIVCETKALSEPAAIAACLFDLAGSFERVGLEAGPLPQWLYFGLRDVGFPPSVLRHVFESGHRGHEHEQDRPQ